MCRAHQRLRDVVMACHHGSDLIENPPGPTQTIVRQAVTAPHDVRVLRRAMERPVENGPARSAERLAVPFDDDVQVGGREWSDVPRTSKRFRRRGDATRGTFGDITTEHRLVLETV